jgi:prepilin-type processing-associated H-X9-DG protein
MSETVNNSERQEVKKGGPRTETVLIWAVVAFVVIVFLLWMLRGLLFRTSVHFGSTCGTNASGLVKAMMVYSNDDHGRLPAADKWCDLLVGYDFTAPKQFVCDRSDAREGESSYAINKNLDGKDISNVPGDIVLVFETNYGKEPGGRQERLANCWWYRHLSKNDEHGLYGCRGWKRVYKRRWNQNGGPEILTTENHDGKGCSVAFVDTHVEFVQTEELGSLKWTVEDSEKGPNRSVD